MMKFKKVFALLLGLCMVLQINSPVNIEAMAAGSIRGILVNTKNNIDFPSQTDLSIKALGDELQGIVDYAAGNSFNTLFFEARPDNGALYSSKQYPKSTYWVSDESKISFFDPLGDLLKRAKKSKLSVYAVINPQIGKAEATEDAATYMDKVYKKNMEDIEALSKKYDIDGIVIENLPSGEGFENFNSGGFLEGVKSAANGKKVGIVFSDTAAVSNALATVDFVLPNLGAKANFKNSGYINELNEIKKANENVFPISDIKNTEDITAKNSVNHFLALNNGYENFVFDGFKALSADSFMQESLLLTVGKKDEALFGAMPKFAPAQTLSITRPKSAITIPYSTYFIMGTSNPGKSLYMNQTPVERTTDNGTFGVLVNLQVGVNKFSFTQGDKVLTVSITRTAPSTGVIPINKITSAFPKYSAILEDQKEGELRCVAPAGGSVIAKISGETINLTQNVAAQQGTPAVYSAKITLNSADPTSVKNLGKVAYSLSYNGGVSSFISDGDVYLKGGEAKSYVVVDKQYANVLTDEVKLGNFKSIYKDSTLEEVVGMKTSAGDDYYELKSGGFISSADVAVVEDGSAKSMTITSITSEENAKGGKIRFVGGAGLPYSFKDGEDGSTSLYLYGNINLCDAGNISIKSDIYSSYSISSVENGVKMTLMPIKKNEIWGMDIVYEGNDAVLYTNKKAKISSDPLHPLSNLTVVIDPGHGGVDSGALGVLGTAGPLEKELNFANAQMLGARLQKLGAKVVLTRQSNEDNPTLFDRMDAVYDNYADIFISLHHNSVAEIADGNKNSGVETYYFTNFGKELAENVMNDISKTTADRDLRKSQWNYFVVTKTNIAPAILTEIGFLPNPLEYEKVCHEDEIFKTSEAITVSILKMMGK